MKKNNKIRIVFMVTAVIIFVAFGIFTYNSNNVNKNLEAVTSENVKAFDLTNELSETNKYAIKNISGEEIATMYYNDYKSMIVNFPDEAYEMLYNDNVSKDEFLNLREKLLKDYYSYSYKSYSSYEDTKNKCMIYKVADTKGKVFVFRVYAVMQYEVNIAL